MKRFRGSLGWMLGGMAVYLALVLGFAVARGASAMPAAPAAGPAAFGKPTTSSPIALSANNELLWVVNPDSDTVSVFRTSDNAKVISDIAVGDEPQSIALHPNNTFAYVANAAGNSITVIKITSANVNSFLAAPDTSVGPRGEIITGAEPWNIVISPDGNRVFVANSAQDTISVLRTDTNALLGSVNVATTPCNDQTGDNVGDPDYHFQPRGLAVTQDSTRLFVTRFFSFTGGAAPKQATDNGKQGVVCRFSVNTAATSAAAVLSAPSKIALAPQITGFKIDTNADGTPDTDTTAYPNQMQSVVIRGDRAFLPNIAASPTGPLKFNVDTQAFVSQISGVGSAEADGGALNLHLGARTPEANKTKLFFANPWAIAFTNQSGAGAAYVVSAGSDLLVKLNVDAANTISFTGGAGSATTRYIDLHDPANPQTSGANAGKNPLGIAICDSGACAGRAYVMNYVSRNVSVVDTNTDTVVAVQSASALPPPGTQEEQLHVGKEIFFSSRGVFDNGSRNRLSSEGWQNCASCHFNGLTDSVVWSFNAGPRKSVPLNATWSPHNPDDQRVLNYSAIFDEVQDFELNIRNVSGPGAKNGALDPDHGLIIPDTTALTDIVAFAKPNGGRPQQTVTLPGSSTAWPALDAMKEWVRFAVRTPNGALDDSVVSGGISSADISAGRRLFFRSGCQTCHGGTKWTVSSRDFAPPPAGAAIATETNPAAPAGVSPIGAQYLFEKLRNVGTFGFNTAGIGAAEKTQDAKDALGKDHNLDGKGDGFNIPSLLGIWSLPPYYHNGGCETLACVLADTNHRVAGRPALSASDQAQIVAFLQSLDAATAFPSNLYVNRHDIFFDPPKLIRGTTVTVGVNVSLFGTKADLADLLNGGSLTVQFSAPGLNDSKTITAADFGQDFGQATVTTSWNVPNSTGRVPVTVTVSSGGAIPEANERDNSATRRVLIENPTPDTTPPAVTAGSVNISDDNPFTVNDPIATTRNVKIRFQASDSGGSGVASACVVRYSYDARQRRWVEEECRFRAVTPDAGSSDTFTIDAQLPDRVGTAYAFVWVKDGAGNISRRPGFDVISYIPGAKVFTLERNDTRLFRITLDAGQSLTLTFTPSVGDIDVLLFKNGSFQSSSANSGTQPESVTLSSTANGTLFQVEVHAVVNSRFTAGVSAGAAAARPAADTSALAATTPTPIVAGPPAQQAAIEGIPELFVPVAQR
ncbi:beta-propeller fold lactonase family protein [Kouleothrix sp.]|uniref:beta-propeller fold lactonase family protein n=1 Tax=Kouleothrix sp. TaxID=2779161 RepID=UPI00391D3EBB